MVKSIIITLSNLSFYQKILRKYQRGKKGSFRFPLMIFSKNLAHVLSHKINIDVLVRIQSHDHITASFLSSKDVRAINELFRTERLSKIILWPFYFKTVQSFNKIVTLHKNILVFSWFGNRTNTLNRALASLFSAANVYPQTLILKNSCKHLNIQLRQSDLKQNMIEFGSLLEPEPSSISSQFNLLLNDWVSSNVSLYANAENKLSTQAGIPKQRPLIHGEYVQITMPFPTIKSGGKLQNAIWHPLAQKKSKWKDHFEPEPSSISSQFNLFLNNRASPNVSFYANAESKFSTQAGIPKQRPLIHGEYVQITMPTSTIKSEVKSQKAVLYLLTHKKSKQEDYFEPGLHSTLPFANFFKLRFLSFKDYIKNMNLHTEMVRNIKGDADRYQSTQKENRGEYHPFFEYRLQSILSQVNPSVNTNYNSGENFSSPIPMQRKDALKSVENFYFYNQKKLEKTLDQLKKTIEETKKAVSEVPISSNPRAVDIQHHIDVNRISDQVYQMINRNIRIEAERRGIL